MFSAKEDLWLECGLCGWGDMVRVEGGGERRPEAGREEVGDETDETDETDWVDWIDALRSCTFTGGSSLALPELWSAIACAVG